MKIVVTGSLGHISKPLTGLLVKDAHEVTVISSNAERAADITAAGAIAAIGNLDDEKFLTETFSGADAVYCMIPPGNFRDKGYDIEANYMAIANAYKNAVLSAGVKRVVHLSSIGAHTDTGNGMLRMHHAVEGILRELPADVAVSHMRPVGFYYNMFAYIPSIRFRNAIVQNYGNLTEPWVSPIDIASVVAEEITKPFERGRIRYIASDECSCDEVAAVLGNAIGQPGLAWETISDDQMRSHLEAAGFNPKIAQGLVDMNAGRRSGVLMEDYLKHRPVLGKVKLADFAKDFAVVFRNAQAAN